MHGRAAVVRVLELREQGLGARRISRRTGLPLSTVRDWVAGKMPRHSRLGRDNRPPPEVCSRCGHDEHDFQALSHAYVYLLGLYLGDGCISSGPKDVYRLRITLDSKYPGIINEAIAAAREVMPHNKVARVARRENCVDVAAYSRSWPCLLPQHGPGKKHERAIELTAWQEPLARRWPESLLRGLIHSDGCRFINTGRKWCHPRYRFDNRSNDIRRIFCETCDLVGLHWTIARPSTIYVSRKADVAAMDRFIGPKS